MEDENSSKAVTLPPSTPAPASTPGSTTPPHQHFSPASNADDATAPPSTTAKSNATPPLPPLSSVSNTAGNAVYVESDSNEEPLFQHPPASTPQQQQQLQQPSQLSTQHSAANAMRPWGAVSATPPSTTFLGGSIAGMGHYGDGSGGGGVGSLFPASALSNEYTAHDSVSQHGGQAIPLGRDVSNRRPLALAAKPRTTAGMMATYVDSSNSESFSSPSLGGAQRSLFRATALPASPMGAFTRWGGRTHGEDGTASATAAPCTPLTPALAGDAVLVMEPPTPAKQRRTVHHSQTGATANTFDPSLFHLGPRLSATTTAAAATTTTAMPTSASAAATSCPEAGGSGLRGAAPSPPKPQVSSVRAAPAPQQQRAALFSTTSPSLPRATTPSALANNGGNNSSSSSSAFTAAPSLNFKFHKREGSRKRSADVLSQFSALDLDETPATPYGQTTVPGRFHSLGGGGNTAFPSQPSASLAALRYPSNAGPTALATGASVCPTSPLMAGYATPVTLSQQIGGANTFSQMLLHPSQDVLDMSQADTECSNFLARRILNNYNEVRLLGRGAFGTVSLYQEISSGEYVAVKTSPPLRAADMERRYRRERSIMGLARGLPHIVQLSAAWEEGRVPRMYLQLEYCPGGSLAALAAAKQARHEPWPEAEVKVFLAHMGIALDALHRADIAHVDFKPDNVLIDKDGAYKLSDFGCSVLLDANGRPRAETQNGYNLSVSPGRTPQQQQQQQNGGTAANAHRHRDTATGGASVFDFNWNEGNETSNASVDEGDCRYLCADMLNEKRHFKAGDLFSLGMSLYELMSGQPLPRNGDQFLALRRQVPVEMLRRRGYSVELVRLVAALLHSDPLQRPTARQVLQYLRPSPAELQLLADPSAMQQWTTSAASFQSLHEQQPLDKEGPLEGKQSTNSDRLPPTVAALRCVSALVEASSWLLATTQQDVHRAMTKATADSGDEEAQQQQQQQQRQQQQKGLQPPPPPPQPRMQQREESELEWESLPMSPIGRQDACTPTTLNY